MGLLLAAWAVRGPRDAHCLPTVLLLTHVPAGSGTRQLCTQSLRCTPELSTGTVQGWQPVLFGDSVSMGSQKPCIAERLLLAHSFVPRRCLGWAPRCASYEQLVQRWHWEAVCLQGPTGAVPYAPCSSCLRSHSSSRTALIACVISH